MKWKTISETPRPERAYKCLFFYSHWPVVGPRTTAKPVYTDHGGFGMMQMQKETSKHHQFELTCWPKDCPNIPLQLQSCYVKIAKKHDIKSYLWFNYIQNTLNAIVGSALLMQFNIHVSRQLTYSTTSESYESNPQITFQYHFSIRASSLRFLCLRSSLCRALSCQRW